MENMLAELKPISSLILGSNSCKQALTMSALQARERTHIVRNREPEPDQVLRLVRRPKCARIVAALR